MQIKIAHTDELSAAAKQFVAALSGQKHVAFEGEMGAGKTTFIAAVLKEMGVEEFHGSPTYGLVNQYISSTHGTIYHFDFYRIESEQEAFDAGIDELINDGSICFMEWPSKLVRFLPEETVWVRILVELDRKRVVEWF